MATQLTLPDQLEGVEGIMITRWLVKEGAQVKSGDVIVEVATDKVDTEIPAPADGTILKINYQDGEVMPENAVLGVLGAEGETVAEAVPAPAQEKKAAAAAERPAAAPETEATGDEAPRATPVARRMAQEMGVALAEVKGSGPRGQVTKEDILSHQTQTAAEPQESPLLVDPQLADIPSLGVSRLAAEHNLNLREIAGDRPLAALGKYDILSALASREAGKPVTVRPRRVAQWQPEPAAAAQARPEAAPRPAAAAAAPRAETPKAAPQTGEELIPHSRMRQLIARNTVQSAFGIPHVTTMWDVNMAAVLAHRAAHKAEFAAAGVNLTVTAYFVQAAIAGLKAVPAANARWSDEGLIVRHYYNIGMAVALPADKNGVGGLSVPVIQNTSDLNLMGIARAVNDLAQRARSNQLKPAELQGGTFTLTNYGTSGSRFQTPVIHDNQAGILGVGAIEKRPVVVSQGHPLEANTGDYLAFLPMTTLGFSYDHRILDGASADAFCAAVKDVLENWS